MTRSSAPQEHAAEAILSKFFAASYPICRRSIPGERQARARPRAIA
ncbi:MAG: hypothetical protein ACLQMH_12015 [Solirubrobacteraceae bacterium]